MNDPTDPLLPALRTPPPNLAAAVETTARIDALAVYLGTLRGEIHDRAREQIEAVAEAAGGGGFTFRAKDVGQAILTDPDPKGRVTGTEAFADWIVESHLARDQPPYGELVEAVTRARITDEQALVTILDEYAPDLDVDDWRAVCFRLVGCLAVETSWVVAEDALDRLVEAGRIEYVEVGDGWRAVDTRSGEAVPGVTVTRTDPALQIRVDADAKRDLATELAEILGPPALDAGVESH